MLLHMPSTVLFLSLEEQPLLFTKLDVSVVYREMEEDVISRYPLQNEKYFCNTK